MLEGETLFVSGAAGLTGAALVRAVATHCPSARVRGTWYNQEPSFQHKHVDYVQADLTDRAACRAAVEGCTMAVLTAAHTGGAADTLTDPSRQVTDNLLMDACLLEALHQAGCRKIVYFSSAVVYQDLDGSIREDDLNWNADPSPAYAGIGWVKRTGEKLCQFWHEKYGHECVILRAANIYGPFAKFDPTRSNFVPALIRKAVDGMDPFEVWGSEDVTRDIIYVDDVVAAVLAVLGEDALKWGIFNLGSDKTVRVRDVVAEVLRATDHSPETVQYAGDRPVTIKHRVLNCERLRNAVDWAPSISIEEGVARTTQWWKENRTWWTK